MRRCKGPRNKPIDRAEAWLRSGSAMLPGWRSQQKSAPGWRKRQSRQGEVSQAGANGNTSYSALLAFRSNRTHRCIRERSEVLSRACCSIQPSHNSGARSTDPI
jgi:hypothetical protein